MTVTIFIANNEIAQQRNAKRTKTLVDKMRSKAYDLAILNMTRRIKDNTQSGIDIQVQPEKDEMVNRVFDEANTNHGPGKYLPKGPTCIYNGKTIPCATYVSESGGITADILVAVLTVLDELDTSPHDSRITMFMFIDDHSSRLYPKFLTYINNFNHQWKVCLGVPYVMSLW